jgi:hypothetical protein
MHGDDVLGCLVLQPGRGRGCAANASLDARQTQKTRLLGKRQSRQQIAQFTDIAGQAWPGNIREPGQA